MKNTLVNRKLIMLAALLLTWSCATGSKPKSAGGSGLVKSEKDENSFDDEPAMRFSGSTFVHSLSNSRLTSRVVSRSNAEQIASRLRSSVSGGDAKAKKALASLIAAQRLAGKSLNKILANARKLADLELKSGVANEIPGFVRLEIGLAALQSNNFAMFDFMVLPLTSSKTSRLRAAAYNAIGVVTLREGRIPEAVQYFQKALKAVSGYEAAALNLAFVSLANGDPRTAKSMLGRLKKDWFVKSGLLVLARQDGDKSTTDRLCRELVGRSHKPSVFNCGLHEWIANKNGAKAKSLINKALKMKGGSSKWDEKAYKVLNSIRGG